MKRGYSILSLVFILGCSGSSQQTKSVLSAAIACNEKGVAILNKPESCEMRRAELEVLLHADSDCQRAFVNKNESVNSYPCYAKDGGSDE